MFAQGTSTLEQRGLSEVSRSCSRFKVDWKKQLHRAGRAKAGGSYVSFAMGPDLQRMQKIFLLILLDLTGA